MILTKVLKGFAALTAVLAVAAMVLRGVKVAAPAVFGLWMSGVLAALATEVELLGRILEEVRHGGGR